MGGRESALPDASGVRLSRAVEDGRFEHGAALPGVRSARVIFVRRAVKSAIWLAGARQPRAAYELGWPFGMWLGSRMGGGREPLLPTRRDGSRAVEDGRFEHGAALPGVRSGCGSTLVRREVRHMVSRRRELGPRTSWVGHWACGWDRAWGGANRYCPTLARTAHGRWRMDGSSTGRLCPGVRSACARSLSVVKSAIWLAGRPPASGRGRVGLAICMWLGSRMGGVAATARCTRTAHGRCASWIGHWACGWDRAWGGVNPLLPDATAFGSRAAHPWWFISVTSCRIPRTPPSEAILPRNSPKTGGPVPRAAI